MAHFAILNQDNIVESVVVVSNETILVNGNESEQLGIDFLSPKFPNKKIVQTSYSKSFRKNFAGIGYKYDAENDVFISQKPFLSWILNENFNWIPPVQRPNDGKKYIWVDTVKNWVEEAR